MKKYLVLMAKGLAMGAADVVPGVSGGTIAFISGIYETLLASIAAVNFGLIKILRTEGVKGVWNAVNGAFLLPLLSGIALSILTNPVPELLVLALPE
jgi:putative membrane protein